MSKPFRVRFLLWAYGALNAAIVGAAGALGAIPAGKLFGSMDFTVRQLGAVAAGAALSAFAAYIYARQLPPIEEE